jgi:hypothetical protein
MIMGVNLNRSFKRSVLATAFFLAVTSSASAENIAETVSKFGLIGTWATDCSIAPDRSYGTRMIYKTASDGRVIHHRDFGDISDDNEVVSAVLSDDGTLNLRVVFSLLKQTREYGIVKQPDGSIRVIYNRDKKNEYSIRDGKITANGEQSRSIQQCK